MDYRNELILVYGQNSNHILDRRRPEGNTVCVYPQYDLSDVYCAEVESVVSEYAGKASEASVLHFVGGG